MPTQIREVTRPGGMQRDGTHATITIITPGEGASAVYSPQVLEQAAKDRVFHSGLHMFLDHADEQKAADYPVGRVHELAAVLVEDAVWTGEALEAKALIFDQHADELREKQDWIGVSIRAYAEAAPHKPGELPVVTRITEALSVDFVTQAGRGGSYRITESVQRAIKNGVQEATANQTRNTLNQTLRAAYNQDNEYVWVLDYDPDRVWFEYETADTTGYYEIGYTLNDAGTAAELVGEPIEVQRLITYVPVSNAGQSEETQPKENRMPEISEQELSSLRAEAARAEAAEQELKQAREEAHRSRIIAAESAARTLVTEAFAEAGIDAPKTVERLAAAYPATEAGDLDVDAFTPIITEAAAELAAAAGAGRPTGFGASTPTDLTEADYYRGLGITVKEA